MTMTWPMMPASLGPQAIDENAEHDAQQRAGEHGQRHHEAFLRGVERQVRGHLHGEGAEQHPDHEAHVKVEERGQQRGKMPRLQELAIDHCTPR